MDLAVQIPVPADEQVHPWPGDLCRRCRASGLAVRRPRRQFRARGRREFGVEARSRAARNVARGAAGELPYRTQCGGRREHPRIHPLDRLHGAQLPPGGAAAQGGAVARQGNRVRQAHGECGAALDALDLRDAALDRRWRFVARRPASRRVDGGCAGCRPGRRADVPDRSLHTCRNAVHACWRLAMVRPRKCPKGWERSALATAALPMPQGLPPRATMPNPAASYLLRPDGYVAARFRHPTREGLDAALARAAGHN